jgi:Leucine-rich repeat (LRR) protein
VGRSFTIKNSRDTESVSLLPDVSAKSSYRFIATETVSYNKDVGLHLNFSHIYQKYKIPNMTVNGILYENLFVIPEFDNSILKRLTIYKLSDKIQNEENFLNNDIKPLYDLIKQMLQLNLHNKLHELTSFPAISMNCINSNKLINNELHINDIVLDLIVNQDNEKREEYNEEHKDEINYVNDVNDVIDVMNDEEFHNWNNSERKLMSNITILRLNGSNKYEDNVTQDPPAYLTYQLDTFGDLSNLPKLHTIECHNTKITSLNGLEKLSNLRKLVVNKSELVSISQISKLNKLEYLDVDDNKLVSLKGIYGLYKLKILSCGKNQLENLNNIGYLNQLEKLYCSYNLISSIDISIQNLKLLKIFECNNNNLTSINLEEMPNLEILNCNMNNLESINLEGTNNLIELFCAINKLISVNLNGMTKLETLVCSHNNLLSINLQGLINLKQLWCNANKLTSINLEGMNNLKVLKCTNNELTLINLNRTINLEELDCNTNNLTSINLEGLINLKNLDCKTNKLTSINLEGLINLRNLDCTNNNISLLVGIENLTNLKKLYCKQNKFPIFETMLIFTNVFIHNPYILYQRPSNIKCDFHKITTENNNTKMLYETYQKGFEDIINPINYRENIHQEYDGKIIYNDIFLGNLMGFRNNLENVLK